MLRLKGPPLPRGNSSSRKVQRLVLSGTGAVLFLTAALCGCKGHEQQSGSKISKPRIAYVTNGVASFWVIAKAGVEAAAKQLDVDATVHMPAEGIAEQQRILQDLLVRGVDGIAISPIDPANEAPLIDEVAAKAKVITHDSDAPQTKRLAYIGMDNYLAGRLEGKLVKEALPDGGTIMILIGRLEQDNAKRRRQGTIDEILDRSSDPTRYDPPEAELKNGTYEIVGTLTDQFDRAKAKANCEDAITRYPDLGALVGLFAYNPPLCLEALKQTGKVGVVKLIAFDEDDETLKGIAEGQVHGTVVQNPYEYGFQSVKMLAGIIRGDAGAIPPGGMLDIPARQIRKDNVEQFRQELAARLKQ